MTREKRLAILGAATVAEIHRQVAEAPQMPDELIDDLRRIFAPAWRQARNQRADEQLQSAA